MAGNVCGLCRRDIALGGGVAAFRGGIAHLMCWLEWRDGRKEAARPVVLVVDDHDATRYASGRALRDDFEVIEVATATAALDEISKKPDLVLLDLQLPDLDGFEVCRRIKTNPATAWIRVVPFTAVYTSDGDRRRAIDAGADGFLIKPVPSDALLATVKHLVGIA